MPVILTSLLIIFLISLAGIGIYATRRIHTNPKLNKSKLLYSKSVLGISTSQNTIPEGIYFNIPVILNNGLSVNGSTILNGNTAVENTLKVKDNLTAPNILYGINAGQNITITGNLQNPTISANLTGVLNSGVTSLGGVSGTITLGSGISLTNNILSNSEPGTSQNMFKNINANGTTFAAGSNNDTLTFTPGGGISFTTDTANKKITISSNSYSPSGLIDNGVLYANGSSAIVSLSPGSSGLILQSNGSGSPPSWVPISGATPSFANITTGTNTGASMLVGSGANLDVTGTGTINATSLNGETFESPGSIGSIAANSGAFTSLSAASLSLSNNTNELILGSGNTGTLSLASLGGPQTYTLPDQSGTFCLTTGNCSGSGGTIAGAGQ